MYVDIFYNIVLLEPPFCNRDLALYSTAMLNLEYLRIIEITFIF